MVGVDADPAGVARLAMLAALAEAGVLGACAERFAAFGGRLGCRRIARRWRLG